jgi:hypothetical protein
MGMMDRPCFEMQFYGIHAQLEIGRDARGIRWWGIKSFNDGSSALKRVTYESLFLSPHGLTQYFTWPTQKQDISCPLP